MRKQQSVLAPLACVLVVIAASCGSAATTEARGTGSSAPAPSLATASPEPTASPTPTPTPRPIGKFVVTGSMKYARQDHTATLLEDGRVLIAGGWNSGPNDPLSSAELYNPKTGKFTSTGSMRTARTGHTATRLANGKVLIVGGSSVGDDAQFYASAEIYDPKTGRFTRTGSMTSPGTGRIAVLLSDGRVFVVGGDMGGPDAEIYDPDTGTFRAASFNVDPWISGATLLADERVLIVGGEGLAWIYDPRTDSFGPTGSMTASRSGTAILLADGRVFVAGSPVGWLYDPAAGVFAETGATAVGLARLLTDGAVLVIAEDGSAEVYDPATGTSSRTGSLGRARLSPSATVLQDGRVLVAGGQNPVYEEPLFFKTAELYVP